MKKECIAMLLAGGQGSRLGVLTKKVAKPAVPYGGKYRIGLPQMGTLTECFNTDRKEYGGSNQYNNWAIRTEEEQLQDFQYSCDICVPPLATVYFTYQRDPLPEKAKKARVVPEIADVPLKKASQTAKKPQPLPEKSAGKANSISIG